MPVRQLASSSGAEGGAQQQQQDLPTDHLRALGKIFASVLCRAPGGFRGEQLPIQARAIVQVRRRPLPSHVVHVMCTAEAWQHLPISVSLSVVDLSVGMDGERCMI